METKNSFDLSGLFSDSFTTFKNNIWFFVKILLLFFVLPLSLYDLFSIIIPMPVFPNITILYHILFVIVVSLITSLGTLSIMYLLLKKPSTKSVFSLVSEAFSYYPKFLLLSIMLSIILFFLFLALIIPGIIFMIYWYFSQYVLIDKNSGIFESMKKSMNLVKHNWWRTFGLMSLILLVIFIPLFIILIAIYIPVIVALLTITNSVLLILIQFGVSLIMNFLVMFFMMFFFVFMYHYYLFLKKINKDSLDNNLNKEEKVSKN